MAKKRETQSQSRQSSRPPAKTPIGRENQLVSAAVDLAERQLKDGSASAQVITHYLKLGSSRERLEQERLANENRLLEAKREAMVSAARVEELYGAAIDAMRAYAGHSPLNTGDIDEGE